LSSAYGLPVTAIATLDDILATLRGSDAGREHVDRMRITPPLGVATG
jgi:hypothetical protein